MGWGVAITLSLHKKQAYFKIVTAQEITKTELLVHAGLSLNNIESQYGH